MRTFTTHRFPAKKAWHFCLFVLSLNRIYNKILDRDWFFALHLSWVIGLASTLPITH